MSFTKRGGSYLTRCPLLSIMKTYRQARPKRLFRGWGRKRLAPTVWLVSGALLYAPKLTASLSLFCTPLAMESLNACWHSVLQKPKLFGVESGSKGRINYQIVKASLTQASIQEEAIQRELQKEREKLARQAEEEAAEKQRANDKARKELREWWTQKWEAKKRSEGWGGNEKCWVLRGTDAAQGYRTAVISGEGILVGAAPLVSGSIKPFVVDFPKTSSVHAHVYGKDVVKSYKKYVREYFVVDLGSTNGTYLNRSKLRPRTEVKLSSGDTLKFGDERAVFVVESQKQAT